MCSMLHGHLAGWLATCLLLAVSNNAGTCGDSLQLILGKKLLAVLLLPLGSLRNFLLLLFLLIILASDLATSSCSSTH